MSQWDTQFGIVGVVGHKNGYMDIRTLDPKNFFKCKNILTFLIFFFFHVDI